MVYALSIGTKIIDLGWLWTAASSNFLGILRYFSCLRGKCSYTNEDRPAFSATELFRTESTFQRCIDDVDIAWRSYVRGDLVSCVRYTTSVARLPLR